MHFQEDQRRTATTPEAQRVGRTLLQRLATGATSVKQARYKQLSTDYYEEHVRACVVYRAYVSSVMCVLTVQFVCIQSLHLRIPPRVLHFSAIHVFGNRNRHYNLSCGVSIGQYDGALTVFTRIFSETKGKEGMNTLVTFEYDTWFVSYSV